MGGPSLVGGVNDDVVGPSAPGADRLVLSAPGALGIIPDHSGTDSDAKRPRLVDVSEPASAHAGVTSVSDAADELGHTS